MKRCPICDQVAELAANGLNDGDLHGRMLEIAALVTHEPDDKKKEFSPDVERLFEQFVEQMGVEPRGIRSTIAWKDALRLMISVDKMRAEEVGRIIKWVSEDVVERGSWKGWRYVIASTVNLRKHCQSGKIQRSMCFTQPLPEAMPDQKMEF